MKIVDLDHAVHALLTAASRFDASGDDQEEIELQYPIPAVDLAIIQNHQREISEMQTDLGVEVKIPPFKCPDRLVAIGREVGLLFALIGEEEEIERRLQNPEAGVDYWLLKNDRVVDQFPLNKVE